MVLLRTYSVLVFWSVWLSDIRYP